MRKGTGSKLQRRIELRGQAALQMVSGGARFSMGKGRYRGVCMPNRAGRTRTEAAMTRSGSTGTRHHDLTQASTDSRTVDATSLAVRMCSYPRPPATVIELSGEIDACDAEQVSDYLVGYVHVDHPLVLDCSRVDFLSVAGHRATVLFAEKCHRAGRDWVLITSTAVDVLLRVVNEADLPVVASLDEGLRTLAQGQQGHRSITTVDCKRC